MWLIMYMIASNESVYDAKHLTIAYLEPFGICGSCDTCDICSYKRSLLQEKLSFVEEVVLVTAVDSHGMARPKRGRQGPPYR